ncbi:hypothetical protein MASRES_GEN12912_15360 [Acinetobacter baumannii]
MSVYWRDPLFDGSMAIVTNLPSKPRLSNIIFAAPNSISPFNKSSNKASPSSRIPSRSIISRSSSILSKPANMRGKNVSSKKRDSLLIIFRVVWVLPGIFTL